MFFGRKNDDEFQDWESYKAAREEKAEMPEENKEENGDEERELAPYTRVLAILAILVLAGTTLIFAFKYEQAQKRIKELEAERFDLIRFFTANIQETEEEPYWNADDEVERHDRKYEPGPNIYPDVPVEPELETPIPPDPSVATESSTESSSANIIDPEEKPSPKPVEGPEAPMPSIDPRS